MFRARRLRHLWLLACALVVVGGCPSAASALAPDPNYWKSSAATRDAATRFFYANSPQSIPTGYDPVAEAERYTSQAARSAPATNPVTEKLAAQTRTVTARAALMPAVRSLGAIGLGVGTFELGWKIGTGINAKFLRVGLPPPPEPKTRAAAGTLVFQAPGPISSYNDALLPEPGWVLQYPAYGQQWTAVNLYEGWESPAAYLIAPPAGFRELLGFSPVGWGVENPPTASYWLPENNLGAHFAEDYTDQPADAYWPAPAPPLQSFVETTIEDELDDPSNAELRDFLNYNLGSPGASDPLGAGATNPDIAFPRRFEKFETHHEEFPNGWTADDYWRRAAEIIELSDEGLDPDIGEPCERPRDGAVIYFNARTGEMVIVKGGEIDTFYVTSPSHYEFQCNDNGSVS